VTNLTLKASTQMLVLAKLQIKQF